MCRSAFSSASRTERTASRGSGTSELDESSRDVVEVGDALTVKIIDVDLARRRIALSHVQALTSTTEGQPCD
ncbi:S1 RNA-binding domain-containing protein [Streptomyces parvus]|uniref:S1 RNA-binding domain-containing protein n=1 Tax=Streptomyces parvus TaxID=66428 RepID=UPI0033AA379B